MLRIVGRRADGYHLLQTVFQLLDRGDRVWVRVRDDGDLRRLRGAPGVGPEQDLAVRAAQVLKAAGGTSLGADILIDKCIPMGGGFGGGSSNAATVLRALDLLWGLGLGEDALAGLGLGLGADVPVFVRGHSAWAEGLGERLTPLPLGASWYVIIDPAVHVATGALFQAPDLTRDASPATIPDFVSGRCVENVFQPIVVAREPRIARALEALSRFGRACLTGTGGGCFVAMGSRDEAELAARALSDDWNVHIARGVDRSPLLDELDRTGH